MVDPENHEPYNDFMKCYKQSRAIAGNVLATKIYMIKINMN